MVRTMAEVLRMRKVKALKESLYITLAFDERKPHTVCKYRCATSAFIIIIKLKFRVTSPQDAQEYAMQGNVLGESGYGLVRAWCTDVPSLSELDEDHSRRKSVARHDLKSSSPA